MIRAGFLSAKDRAALVALARDGSAAHRLARRANAMLLLDDGWSCEEVARALYLDDDTARGWARLYGEGGVEGLTRFESGGSGGYLSQAWEEALKSWIAATPCQPTPSNRPPASHLLALPPSAIAYHVHFAHIEAGDARDPALFEKLVLAADRVVVEEQRMGDLPTTPPFVQKHQGVRSPPRPARRRPVAHQRGKRLAIFFAEKARQNRATESAQPENARNFSRLFNGSGYTD